MQIVVFSHLRWTYVYQRPQQLLSRLARQYRILFIEEPVHDPQGRSLERLRPVPGIEVIRPHTEIDEPGFSDRQIEALREPLTGLLAKIDTTQPVIAWFYTPMALPLLDLVPAATGVVYDCMDDLASFRHAPAQLREREEELMGIADLVFCGGQTLYRNRARSHSNVHCFPSSVDAHHFTSGRRNSAEDLQGHIGHPRLGYCGVIDERIDLPLIAGVAAQRPDWNIVLVGPVAKIDEADVPQGRNIHRLGQQPYERLPGLMAGWDVCLMPFALNEATRSISPTKTLEYMAAGKPVVSTPIADVTDMYANVVEIARTPEEFIAACARVMAESGHARAERAARMQVRVTATSWDATVAEMMRLLQSIRRKPVGTAPVKRLPATKRTAARSHYRDIVIGAGPTGLSAAYHLGASSLLIERESTVGGWCRSIVDRGFTFDYAGHIMFSNDSYVHRMYRVLLGENVHWQEREAWIYSHRVYTRYPFQGALYGLPPDVLKECLIGAIEARFGSLKGPAAGTDNAPPRNFEEFIYRVWGRGVAKHFAIPYNRKLWAVPLDEMETSWLGGRVPLPDLEQMIDGALKPVPKPMGPNARFGYPLKGGFQALMDGFLPHLTGDVLLDAEVARIAPKIRQVRLSDGRCFTYDNLISTMPLPALIARIDGRVPEAVREAAAGLRHVSVRCVNLGIGRANLSEKHWVYYPEDTVFHRIFLQGNASPHCNPPGGFGLTCEITYSDSKPLPAQGQALIERCIQDCVRVGMIRSSDAIVTANEVDMPCAYVVYDHERASNVRTIRDWLSESGIVLAGRYSEWEYYNSDHAFIAGRKAAEQVGVTVPGSEVARSA